MATNQANRALTAAGYRLHTGTPSDAGSFNLTVTHGETSHTTNTVRMTLADIGQWLFRAERSAASTRSLGHNSTTHTIFLGLEYILTNPDWWSPEHTCDATLSRLYCEGGIRRTVAHPHGTMFDRNCTIGSVHSGYLT